MAVSPALVQRPGSALPQPWVTLSLLVAFALIAASGSPPRASVMHLFIVGTLLFASLRWRVGMLALAALLLAGVDLRLAYAHTGSDVLTVTDAAIERFLSGGNPYGEGYAVSRPPGAPFPYGPLALLWYLPPIPAQVIETSVAVGIVALLALRGRPLGLAIYAAAPVLVVSAGDGSNDTSLGLLLLVALVVAERLPRVGAFVLGLAIAFKPTAAAWLPPMAAWAGWSGLLAIIVGAGVFWLPALLAWGPASIAQSISRANSMHTTPYYSLAYALERFALPLPAVLFSVVRVAGALLLGLLSVWRVRSAHAVIGWGAALFLFGLFSGLWSTFAYFAAVAPIVCWHIDGWLGHAADRIAWPADPVGRLTRWVDDRWPALESSAQRRTT